MNDRDLESMNAQAVRSELSILIGRIDAAFSGIRHIDRRLMAVEQYCAMLKNAVWRPDNGGEDGDKHVRTTDAGAI